MSETITTTTDAEQVQERLRSFTREWQGNVGADGVKGKMPDLIARQNVRHMTFKYGLTVAGHMGIAQAKNDGAPQPMRKYPLGDDAEKFAEIVGRSQSVAVHRAARALLAGITPDDVADFLFLASRSGSRAARDVEAWAAAYRKLSA